ncbi:hypothetical protein GCM10027169_22990 [Gordonia jinhuaensis]|uniref:Uncharacterized protein n=1 Tax=Gordonia jinhuaensis TaxID=1517702 RepID=A0A916TFW3_9ACTN|nr:hypothetical protein [Gordonia jinhuaensis]GGB41549.1 hypothetical protein GCM10011489_31440 [Gordonia jinhuaensis]
MLDIVACAHPKWPEYLQIVATPDDDLEIEMWIEFYTESEKSITEQIRELSRQLPRYGDRLDQACRNVDPKTGAPGRLHTTQLRYQLEQVVGSLLPAGVEIANVS